jgi:hypothetical protein
MTPLPELPSGFLQNKCPAGIEKNNRRSFDCAPLRGASLRMTGHYFFSPSKALIV